MPRRLLAAFASIGALGLLALSCSSPQPEADVAAPHDSAGSTVVPATLDWPWFGFDLTNSRFNPSERQLTSQTAGSLREVWRHDGLGGMASTPTVVGDVAYVGAWGGEVLALDADTGKQIWSTDLGGAIMASITADDGALYAATNNELARLDRDTGSVVWQRPTSDHPIAISAASPMVVGDLVIQAVASGELMIPLDEYTFRGSIAAYDTTTGQLIWELFTTPGDDTAGNGVGIWSTPSADIERGLVFVGTGNTYEPPAAPLSDSILAIDLHTGDLVWSTQFTYPDVWSTAETGGLDADVGGGPNLWTAAGQDLVGAGDKQGSYHALDRTTGEVLWETKLTPGSLLGGVIGTAAYAQGTIFVASNVGVEGASVPSNEATLFALDAATGTVRWRTVIEGNVYAPITSVTDVVLVGTTTKRLLAFDATTGVELWSTEMPDQVGAGASVVDGTVYWGYGFTLLGRGSGIGGVIALRPGDGSTTDSPATTSLRSVGAQIFRTSCASCHGIDGFGITGPDLHGVADRLSHEDHLATVRDGRRQMPAFESILTDDEIEAVVSYEREELDG